ncbi:MAG: transglutaminase-like domain-containing protein, partial [Defluviitaleaceae bacterium]|nr:transglutaminase-like domain-containing protein [Defluviitaleaceae bacterium]
NQKSLKNIYFREAPFVLYSIPFTALAFALAFIIPTPAEESMTEGRDNFITRSFAALSDNFRAATHPRHFSLAQTGFGGGYSRRLGGNVTTNYGRALRINPQQSLNIMPMYLSGLTFDHYTGYGWRNTLADQQTVFEQGDYNDLDILKLNMLWSNILAERSMIVEHEFHSYNVFLPGQGIVTSIVPLTSQMTFLEDGAGNITTQSLMPRHSRYMVHYVMPMGGHALLDALQREDLQAPVRRVANPSEDDIWAQVVFPHLSVEDLELINNYIVPRIDWIYEHYTQLPDDFSPRVVALAQYITQDAQNNLERANMINDFLRYSGEFGYTLTPGNAPLDQDFVDWFLFDAREGYCTFFATAFVTMMRAVGVPTRYVEGFIVTGGRDADGYISVINRQGHAWAQVYFEGFGWSLFDPTPPGAVFSFSPLPFNPFPFLDRDRNLGSFQDNHDDNWDDWNVDYGAIPPADIPNDDYDAQPIANGYIEPPPSGATPYGEYPYTGTGTFRAFIISIVIAIGIGIIFLACRVLYMLSKEKKLRQKSNNEAVLGYYALILKYLKQFHFRPQASDTPLEFAKKVNRNVISFENEKVFMEDIAYIFYKAKYSDRAISDEEREMHEKALASLDLKLKKYMGPIRYYFSKFVKLELI